MVEVNVFVLSFQEINECSPINIQGLGNEEVVNLVIKGTWILYSVIWTAEEAFNGLISWERWSVKIFFLLKRLRLKEVKFGKIIKVL
jgi:hypothetical protein